MGRVRTLILDWAGTVVDFGSSAPARAFAEAFGAFGIEPTIDEIRAPMGMQKREHIEMMLAGERLAAQWERLHGRLPSRADADAIYSLFAPALADAIWRGSELLPGVTGAVRDVRSMGVKIGSTTGYPRAVMEALAPLAKERGYAPDCAICPDDAGGFGRPYPYMLWRNLEALAAADVREALKAGDTAADMQEAANAGCRSVGIIAGSNMLGLSAEEFGAMREAELRERFGRARRGFFDAGADFVIDCISDLPALIESL
jgi:phosphonoacetaldehyde hydrolase